MSILVFGFEPFLEFDENPAQLVVQHLRARKIKDHEITSVVLPVDYSRIEERIVAEVTRVKPQLVIGFGLAPGREKITPEKIAVNYRFASEPDNTGKVMNGTPIDPKLPDGIFTNLPVEGLVESLNKSGIPSTVSLSAGAYLCNNAMFVIVREARKQNFSGGFIHIPCHSEWIAKKNNKNYPSLPLDSIVESAVQAIIYCLEHSPIQKLEEEIGVKAS
jgi:pyroglutamyl-peptidase